MNTTKTDPAYRAYFKIVSQPKEHLRAIEDACKMVVPDDIYLAMMLGASQGVIGWAKDIISTPYREETLCLVAEFSGEDKRQKAADFVNAYNSAAVGYDIETTIATCGFASGPAESLIKPDLFKQLGAESEELILARF